MPGDTAMQTRLCLNVYGEMYMIDLERVMYLQADDHYTHVYYSSGAHFMVPFGLSKVEAAISDHLPADSFLIRLGRRYIVNTRRIFHINCVKQVLQLSDDHGSNHSLTLPKPILHGLMQMMGGAPTVRKGSETSDVNAADSMAGREPADRNSRKE